MPLATLILILYFNSTWSNYKNNASFDNNFFRGISIPLGPIISMNTH